jgi:hypothetical protein
MRFSLLPGSPERPDVPAAQVPIRGKAFLFSGVSCHGKQLLRDLSPAHGIAVQFPVQPQPPLRFSREFTKTYIALGQQSS